MSTTTAQKWDIDQPIPKSKKVSKTFEGEYSNLNSRLRYTSSDLRTKPRVAAIQALWNSTDPYTQNEVSVENGRLSRIYDVDHIHEVQVIVYAASRISGLTSRAIDSLCTQVNDVSNLVITNSSVNRSKGQVIKWFLSRLDKGNELPLLATLIQTSTGTKRSIAQYSGYIADVI